MRKSSLYLTATTIGFLLLVLLIRLHPMLSRHATAQRLEKERQLVRRLGLTDICLFTEASYMRHPSLAGRFVPFQDHPTAMSHFPSESLLPPPRHLTEDPHASKGRALP